jgi:type II secretory pathway pseudopilin PulG
VNARRASPVRPSDGYGLVEMLVAFTVMAAVMAMVFVTLTRSQGQSRHVTAVAEERQMARTAIQLLEREARMAGSGWGRTRVYGGGGMVAGALNPRFGGVGRSDSLTLLGAWQASTTTTAAMVDETSPIVVADASGFRTGDFLVVTDRQNQWAHLFQATGVDAGTGVVSHSNASPYNTGHTNWPPSGFPNGAYVYRATISSYSFDSTTYRKPVLVRREDEGTPQVIAYDVDGFRVYYQMQDGSVTRNPLNLDMVDKIMPVVITRTKHRGRTLQDSVWAAVRPRTF